MELFESITIKELPDLGGTRRRRYAELILRRTSSPVHNESDEVLMTRLCHDVMSKLGLTSQEIIELERRTGGNRGNGE